MEWVKVLGVAPEKYFLLEIVILLGAASLGGWAAKKIQMPAVLGQIVAGILIGPSLFGWIQGTSELVHIMSEIGVIFLMFLAGLETDLQELRKSGKSSSIIALGGVVVPFVLGTVIPYLFFKHHLPQGTPHQQFLYATYIGTILTATSVSISVSVLRDMNLLGSKQGISILGAAIIDDVIGILLLAVIIGIVSPGQNSNIGWLLLKMGIFFVGVLVIGYIISNLTIRFARGHVWGERIVTFSILLCFLLAFFSEAFQVAAITGAYAAGVICGTTPYRSKINKRIQVLAYSLFTPIFFISIGLKAEISADMLQYIGYGLVVVGIAIAGKMIGCGLGAHWSGFSFKHSLQIGVGMIARAEVALIVATQGLNRHVITNATFTSIVLLVVISTLVTPPLLKYLFKNEGKTVQKVEG